VTILIYVIYKINANYSINRRRTSLPGWTVITHMPRKVAHLDDVIIRALADVTELWFLIFCKRQYYYIDLNQGPERTCSGGVLTCAWCGLLPCHLQ